MKKCIVSAGMVCFLMVAATMPVTVMPSFIEEAGGVTFYVGGNGLGNYTNIQDAIDDAGDGDVIYVYNGTYAENIDISKSIHLVGEHKNATIIDGNGNGTVVDIDGDGVVMRNFTVTGGNGDIWAAGVCITSIHVTLKDNIILDNKCNGISLFLASRCRISYNAITGNMYGGIHITNGSQSNNISYNNIQSGMEGIYVSESDHQAISYNNVTGCAKGIYLTECSGNTVIGNRLTENEEGLFCYYAAGSTISCNDFISNVKNARFAKFFHIGFLAPNKWNSNYWDDWICIGVKAIFGIVYVPTFKLIGIFIPWVEIDWHPASEPYR